MASAPSRSATGRTFSTCRHISAASRGNLTASLLAASSPLKARSSPHWASLPKHSTWHNSLSSRRYPAIVVLLSAVLS